MNLQDVRNKYQNHVPRLLGGRSDFAVLVPLVERDRELHLLYEVRAEGIRQPREVCFPGGKMEAGENAITCALRETWEELGIPKEAIEVIGEGDFIALRANAMMYPVIARVDSEAVDAIHASASEVANTFLVPVKWLQAHPPTLYRYPLRPMIGEDFPFETVQIARDYPWGDGKMEVPVYEGLPYPLWGLTARITYYLLKSFE